LSDRDPVFAAFLRNSHEAARALAGASGGRLAVVPLGPPPPANYLCEFAARYLRRLPSGIVDVAGGPVAVGVHLPADYLRSPDPALGLKVVSMLTPDFFHPNVQGPVICLGSAFAPGTPIRWLLEEVYAIVTYRNYTVDERAALNPEACRLLRQRPEILARLGPDEARRLRPGGRLLAKVVTR
jgi:hypothetical protein